MWLWHVACVTCITCDNKWVCVDPEKSRSNFDPSDLRSRDIKITWLPKKVSMYINQFIICTNWTQWDHPHIVLSNLCKRLDRMMLSLKNAFGFLWHENTFNKGKQYKLRLDHHNRHEIQPSWRFRMISYEAVAVATRSCRWIAIPNWDDLEKEVTCHRSLTSESRNFN